MPVQHPLVDLVLGVVVERDGALAFDDNGILALAHAYGVELVPDRAGPATEALLTLAYFLDVERRSPLASRTILTLVFAAEQTLRGINDEQSARAQKRMQDAKSRFGNLTGDARVTKVLDSGARPAGTVPAGPLARFQVAPKKP